MRTILCLSIAAILSIVCQPSSHAAGRVIAWGNSQYGLTNVPTDRTNALEVARATVNDLPLRPTAPPHPGKPA